MKYTEVLEKLMLAVNQGKDSVLLEEMLLNSFCLLAKNLESSSIQELLSDDLDKTIENLSDNYFLEDSTSLSQKQSFIAGSLWGALSLLKHVSTEKKSQQSF